MAAKCQCRQTERDNAASAHLTGCAGCTLPTALLVAPLHAAQTLLMICRGPALKLAAGGVAQACETALSTGMHLEADLEAGPGFIAGNLVRSQGHAPTGSLA